MSEKKIKLIVEITVKETGDYPSHEAVFSVKGKDQSGAPWERHFSAGGKSEIDAINTVCRKDMLPKTLSAIALVVSQPTPSYTQEMVKRKDPVEKVPVEASPEVKQAQYDEERDAFYEKLHRDVISWKVGVIRKFVADQGLNVKFTNSTAKQEIAGMVIEAVQEKEAARAEKN